MKTSSAVGPSVARWTSWSLGPAVAHPPRLTSAMTTARRRVQNTGGSLSVLGGGELDADSLLQIVQVEGLGDVIDRAHGEELGGEADIGIGRDPDDGHGRVDHHDPLEGLDAVHGGHGDVEETD